MMIKSAPHTYISGLLQAKSFRILRISVNEALSAYDIYMTEWIVLGLIFESKEIKLIKLAYKMEVEAPLITNLINVLIKKGLVQKVPDLEDKRARLLTITEKGAELIPEIEQAVIAKMQKVLSGIPEKHMFIYLSVLEKITENYTNKQKRY